jgi:hypothetical protein
MYRRSLEWQVIGDSPRYLHVRSLDGKFSIRAMVVDEYTRFHWETNQSFTFRYFWEGDPMFSALNFRLAANTQRPDF